MLDEMQACRVPFSKVHEQVGLTLIALNHAVVKVPVWIVFACFCPVSRNRDLCQFLGLAQVGMYLRDHKVTELPNPRLVPLELTPILLSVIKGKQALTLEE